MFSVPMLRSGQLHRLCALARLPGVQVFHPSTTARLLHPQPGEIPAALRAGGHQLLEHAHVIQLVFPQGQLHTDGMGDMVRDRGAE